MRQGRTRTAALAVAGAAMLTACTSAPTTVVDSTVVITRTTTTHPKAVPTTPLDVRVPTETDGTCPYIATLTAAATEGNRIGRVSVLRRGATVVGCRFYFDPDYGAPRQTLDISSLRFADATAAYNAMVRIGTAGTQVAGVTDLAPGVDGVLYRTTFFAPDGNQDWACTFAKGTVVVTIKTDQTDTSENAHGLARLVVGKF